MPPLCSLLTLGGRPRGLLRGDSPFSVLMLASVNTTFIVRRLLSLRDNDRNVKNFKLSLTWYQRVGELRVGFTAAGLRWAEAGEGKRSTWWGKSESTVRSFQTPERQVGGEFYTGGWWQTWETWGWDTDCWRTSCSRCQTGCQTCIHCLRETSAAPWWGWSDHSHPRSQTPPCWRVLLLFDLGRFWWCWAKGRSGCPGSCPGADMSRSALVLTDLGDLGRQIQVRWSSYKPYFTQDKKTKLNYIVV